MSVVNLNSIKTQIRAILLDANTTTAANDLSSGLSPRVQKVLKLASRLPVQATWYPYVTCYIESKNIQIDQIGTTQAAVKRTSFIEVKVLGAVWNSTISDLTADDADTDCEQLMGNIETVLAQDHTLNGSVSWQQATEVKYHNVSLDEGNNVRFGVLTLECQVHH